MKQNFEGIYTNSKFETLDRCEKEYAHKYILKTPKDQDYINPIYFAFGTAFHQVLEFTNYDSKNFTDDILHTALDSNELDPIFDKAKLLKCLESYYSFHSRSRLRICKLELPFSTGIYGGIVDSLGISLDNKWWIVDNKTAAKLDSILPYLLKNNNQLNMYAHFNEQIKQQILDDFGIELQEFGGFIYRETKKPSEKKTKKDLDFESFYNRLNNVETRETKILISELDVKKTYLILNRKKTRCENITSLVINEGIQSIAGNTRNCINSFGQVCKYFSSCHGINYSEVKELGEIDL